MLCKDETVCTPVGVGFHMEVGPKMVDSGNGETPHTQASDWGGPRGMNGGCGWQNDGARLGRDIGIGYVTMMMGLVVGGGFVLRR